MNVIDEGNHLSLEVAKLRRDKCRRYSPDLRRRILDWVGRSIAAGIKEGSCAKVIGVKTWRFKQWRLLEERETKRKPLALIPIRTLAMPMSSGITMVAQSGYRIEGLAIHEVVTLLRALA